MIHVKRQQTTETGRQIQPSEAWLKSAAKKTVQVEEDFPQHRIEEGIYSRQTVRRALRRLFNDKCAYCESTLLNQDWDIEHFRPHGAVAEAPGHPGYYWLAYTWPNLYASCKHCNQKRKDYGSFDEPRSLAAAGKVTHFPLEIEEDRVWSHEDKERLDSERPLLLDPCNEDAEGRFLFSRDGRVVPREATDRRAATTIEILNLDRPDLRQLRQQAVERLRVLEDLKVAAADRPIIAEKLSTLVITKYEGLARDIRSDPERFGFADQGIV